MGIPISQRYVGGLDPPRSETHHFSEVRFVAPAALLTDKVAPASAVAALHNLSRPNFTVQWSGSDSSAAPPEAGIATFDVYVSVNNGGYTLWKSATTETSDIYAGTVGQEYRFYSVATDNVGNKEAVPIQPDASTKAVHRPWQNLPKPLDVDDDTFIAPLDALRVINQLNNPTIIDLRSGKLPDQSIDDEIFYDVDGDGFLAPVDALIVINHLNRLGGSEGEASNTNARESLFAAFAETPRRALGRFGSATSQQSTALPGIATELFDDKRFCSRFGLNARQRPTGF